MRQRVHGVRAAAVLATILGLVTAAGCGQIPKPAVDAGSAPGVAATTTPSSTTTTTADPAPTAGPMAPKPAAKPKPSPTPKPAPKASPRPKPKPAAKPKPKLVPGPTILGAGSSGTAVRTLQARLKQIGWFSERVTGTYGPVTTVSVRGFQAKRAIPATGAVDRRTLDRLGAMTRTPTAAELRDEPPKVAKPSAAGLDARCLTGRAMCISKSSNSLTWVVDGRPQLRVDVRFGAYETPTREGLFHVQRKSPHWVSTIYHTPMPYSMFFSGGQAVHYSADFAARGYAGASHGCVNVRNYSGLQTLYAQARVGDKVVVYR